MDQIMIIGQDICNVTRRLNFRIGAVASDLCTNSK